LGEKGRNREGGKKGRKLIRIARPQKNVWEKAKKKRRKGNQKGWDLRRNGHLQKGNHWKREEK